MLKTITVFVVFEMYNILREGFKKKEKKSREFSLTGGAGSPQFPTYFIFDFVKHF